MKTTLRLIAVAALAASLTAAPDPFEADGKWGTAAVATPARQKKEFRVSRVGKTGAAGHETSAKLREIFAALNSDQDQVNTAQKFSAKILHAPGPGDDIFLCDDPSNADTVIAVRSSRTDLAAGDMLTGYFTRAGTHTYTSRLGSDIRVALYSSAASKPPVQIMTQAEFLADLKAGKNYLALVLETGGCAECFGRGTRGALHRNAPCQPCSGSGDAITAYAVRW